MDKGDNKANLINSKEEDGKFIRIIEENELDDVLDAARSCPVNVIHVYNLETNEELVWEIFINK